MHKIRLLDPDTINKIAAGEVIERPASVVKELIENSIDAGATKVLIEVIEAGKKLIRITDDGCGMDPEDLPLAFQKHATSKIRDAGDLDSIATLGFRGEALASIASVSKTVEIRTRTKDSLSGSYMRLEEGRTSEVKEIGSPIGTTITVWDLFYNVPARKKHLKATDAELVHITDVVTELAIIHHDVSFELFSGKRLLFRSTRSSNWDDVLLRIFDIKTFKGMSRLKVDGPGWAITGAIGDPLSARKNPDRIFIFVNGRAVSSRALSSALRDAYRNIISLGKSPVAVISLQIDPHLVDVNVHPAKREIRLLHEQEIASFLTAAASRTLQVHASRAAQKAEDGAAQAAGNDASAAVNDESESPAKEAITRQTCIVAERGEQRTLSLPPAEADVTTPMQKPRHPVLRIIGQIMMLYIVAEGEDGLVIIDQHAAAERIRFEMLQERYKNRNIRQELVQPISIELSASEMIMMGSWQETLSDIGFDLAPFGGNSYSVRAVPALGRKLEDAKAVHDILRDLFTSGKAVSATADKDEILRLLACKGSIKSGKELSLTEMKRLVDDLLQCKNPLTCPHGRPVMVTIDANHLERLFSRR